MFPAGVSGNPNGRPKGSTNKVHAVNIILEAVDHLQKTKKNNLIAWAKANPTEFWSKVFPKIIPKEIDLSLLGNIDHTLSLSPELSAALIALAQQKVRDKYLPPDGSGEVVIEDSNGNKENSKGADVPGAPIGRDETA